MHSSPLFVLASSTLLTVPVILAICLVLRERPAAAPQPIVV
jgi:hypothetical protein